MTEEFRHKSYLKEIIWRDIESFVDKRLDDGGTQS